jgi:hypothetical protein
MNGLFGVALPTAVNFVIAFVVVLLLIGAAAWLVRRLGATHTEAAARGRQPRLAVVDSAAVDGRRKLVIIRRDNVEHLLMIGGPTDVVVETSIVRAASAAREPAPARNGGEGARALPLADPTAWPLQPESAPIAARGGPRVTVDENQTWQESAETGAVPPPLRALRPADTLAGLAAELARPGADSAQIIPAQIIPSHVEAMAAPSVAPAAGATPPALPDQSLAEMAQRLEAALRRPAAPKPAAEPAPPRSAAPEVRPGSRTEPRAIAAPAAPAPSKPAAPPKVPPPQTAGNNLEQEMASLLGRPGKT